MNLFQSVGRWAWGRVPHWLLCGALLVVPHLDARAAAVDDLYAEAELRTWVRPAYAAEWQAEQLEGTVRVRFIVDPAGAVRQVRAVSSTDARLEPAAIAAVEQWGFAPALERGQPAASGLDVEVVFQLANLGKPTPLHPSPKERPRTLPITPASERRAPDPEYPANWLSRRIPAAVEVEFGIDEQGRVTEPIVTAATHGGFVPAALAALRQWQFRPAMQGDLPRASRKAARLDFEASEISIERGLVLERLEPHGIRARSADEGAAPPWTQEPRLRRSVDPVHPYALALSGAAGEAEVAFTVTVGGSVTDVKLLAASQPEFGAALVAAVGQWGFLPGRANKEPVPAELVVRHVFSDPRAGDGPDAALWKRVAGGEAIGTAQGLDHRLRPVYRVSPHYPEELVATGAAGEARLEFVIDRDGVTRLVRVVSATHAAFGDAASVALSLWCFDPPMRNGEPVDVRVEIPFAFAAPKEPSGAAAQ